MGRNGATDMVVVRKFRLMGFTELGRARTCESKQIGFSSVQCWLGHQLALSGIQLTDGLQGPAIKRLVCLGTAAVRSYWSGEGGWQLPHLYKEPGGSDLHAVFFSIHLHSPGWILCSLLSLPLPFALVWTRLSVLSHQCHWEMDVINVTARWILYNPGCDKLDWSLPTTCQLHVSSPSISCSPSLLLPTAEERSVLLRPTPALRCSGRMIGFWVHIALIPFLAHLIWWDSTALSAP